MASALLASLHSRSRSRPFSPSSGSSLSPLSPPSGHGAAPARLELIHSPQLHRHIARCRQMPMGRPSLIPSLSSLVRPRSRWRSRSQSPSQSQSQRQSRCCRHHLLRRSREETSWLLAASTASSPPLPSLSTFSTSLKWRRSPTCFNVSSRATGGMSSLATRTLPATMAEASGRARCLLLVLG